ncbi:MAG: NADH-quinone oxidoreductase subunit N [Planctomycetes bacterium]|nr:NADH-quinone oxidoreductase subunit N [Planctomycetota bacterium]
MIAQASVWSGVAVGEQLRLFSPMLALTATMLAIVACPLVAGRGPRTIAAVASLGIVAAFVLALRVADSVADGGLSGLSTRPAAGLLLVDNLSIGFQLVLLVFLAAVTWLWWMGSADRETSAPEFFILLIGSALGMALMASTANLLMIVIAIETASLPSYAIVGFDKGDRKAAEASLKYMIFGAVCAAIMLYGASLLYGLVGSLSVADVARYTVEQMAMGESRLLLFAGLLCFLAGIAFKISAVPFHFWCPDAFEGAKIEVTTWLSVASKAAGLVLLARLVSIFCAAVSQPAAMNLVAPLAWTIGIMAAVTCTVGNFAAYHQKSVKRLLAYSSIAHAGYMMMAAAVFLHPSDGGYQSSLTALLVYIVIYLFMNLGAFGVTAMVVWGTGSDDIESFSGLTRRAPWLAVPMVICLVSLVGIPPFAGFLGKWWLLVALGELGGTLGWLLVCVAAVNTLFSLYYYMRVVVKMSLHDAGGPALHGPFGGIALVNVSAAALLVLFLLADPLRSRTEHFARGLFQPPATQAVAPVAGDRSAGATLLPLPGAGPMEEVADHVP